MLKINEIYYSVQGESTKAGLPCVFVRMTYCNLRCTYCDTEYAFYEGKEFSIDQIIAKVKEYNCSLVEITGGEPLLQDETHSLMQNLADWGYEVLLETGGSLSIKNVDPRVKIIMDLKTPSSGMMIKKEDEVKFVIGSRDDYLWSKEILVKYDFDKKCEILFSVIFGKLKPVELVNWILEDRLNVRFQLQMHKFIWKPDERGV
jgi:7-carboxy-7-deazaguanine synthase